MKTYRSSSSSETKSLGRELARKVCAVRVKSALVRGVRKHALVFALSGELGSGKTTFVQGFLRGLGVKKRSTSPTFILFRRFTLHVPRFTNVYHVDAYRIKNPRELLALGFKEILSDSKNIVLIEWAENVKKILPREAVWLRFRHGRKKNERAITKNRGSLREPFLSME